MSSLIGPNLRLASLTGACVLVLSQVATLGCGDPEFGPLTIVTVGDGANPDEPCQERPFSLNRAQGRAMWEGVRAASKVSSVDSLLREHGVVLSNADDCGTEAEAERIGRRFALSPSTLAVIGHGTSGTTAAASAYYSGAGIPLLMPIATSPHANRDGNGERYPATYRLPPGDVRVQAPTMALFATDSLNAQKIYLVSDHSADAATYSQPLFDELVALLPTELLVQRDSMTAQDVPRVARSIEAQSADLVMFVGYGTTANELVSALADVYHRAGIEPPVILLSDGARIPDLQTEGMEVYVTFPLPPIEEAECDSSWTGALEAARVSGSSYELYGFDAMLMLAGAIEVCAASATINRRCVSDHLESLQNFVGACFSYSFVEGENVSSYYSVYEAHTDAPGAATEYVHLIRYVPERITAFARDR